MNIEECFVAVGPSWISVGCVDMQKRSFLSATVQLLHSLVNECTKRGHPISDWATGEIVAEISADPRWKQSGNTSLTFDIAAPWKLHKLEGIPIPHYDPLFKHTQLEYNWLYVPSSSNEMS